MKKSLLILLSGLALGTAAGWVIFHRPAAAPDKAAAAQPAPEEAAPEARTVELKPPQLANAHLEFAAPRWEDSPAEEVGLARTLDPTTFLSLSADLNTAQATLSASQKEAARVRGLHDDGDNASQQAVETAELAEQRDRIQVDTTRAKLRASWGAVAMDDRQRMSLEAALTSGSSLLRVDFASGPALRLAGKTVTLRSLAETGQTALPPAEILGAASTVDPQFQGRSFWALVRGQSLPVGSSYEAVLTLETIAARVLTLPESALVRDQGSTFVYLQSGPGKFTRRLVEILRKVGPRVAVTGIAPADQVVTVGAQELLSTELGGAASGD